MNQFLGQRVICYGASFVRISSLVSSHRQRHKLSLFSAVGVRRRPCCTDQFMPTAVRVGASGCAYCLCRAVHFRCLLLTLFTSLLPAQVMSVVRAVGRLISFQRLAWPHAPADLITAARGKLRISDWPPKIIRFRERRWIGR